MEDEEARLEPPAAPRGSPRPVARGAALSLLWWPEHDQADAG